MIGQQVSRNCHMDCALHHCTRRWIAARCDLKLSRNSGS
jgi:hypothetical protein